MITRVFDWYDDLNRTNPSLRFLIFMVFAMPLMLDSLFGPDTAMAIVVIYMIVAALRYRHLRRASLSRVWAKIEALIQ